MKGSPKNCRAVASLVIKRVIEKNVSLPLAIAEYSDKIAPAEQALLQEITYGSCRFYYLLSGLIDQLISKPLRKKDQDIYSLLIVGAYQLNYMRIPAHAVLSETVSATKALNKSWAKGMVNGILRNIQRDNASLTAKLKPDQAAAMPPWLFDDIQTQWPQCADDIFVAYQQAPPMTLRVNQQKTTRAAYHELLSQVGIEASPCQFSPDGLVLAKGVPVEALPHFADGFCSVQDEAAQLAAQLINIDPQPKHILDACAAPGGKTCHLIESNPQASIVALDNDEQRLLRVSDNLARLNLTADIQCADAADLDAWWDGTLFDAILLDAPCSATGVIRRNPDIKLLRQAQDINPLPPLQLLLLKTLWNCLKPGGSLLYVTCSLLQQENDAVIAKAIDEIPDARVDQLKVDWGIATQHGRQLLPSTNAGQNTDGFYYSHLTKL